MIVVEESVEVANAIGKIRSSEAKIVELRKNCYPVTTASVQQAPDGPENGSQLAVDASEETQEVMGNKAKLT